MTRAILVVTVLAVLSSPSFGQSPYQLAFDMPPATTVTAAVLWPAFTVRIEDQQGVLVPGATDPVQVTLASGSGTLHGTLTRAAQGGTATFDDLWYDAIEPLTITVSSGSLVGIGPTAVTVGGVLQVGPAAPYPTYLSALNALVSLVPGLEIHVAPGVYQEGIPNPGVIVQGADRETTIFEGGAWLYSNPIPAVLRSLTIKGTVHAEAGAIEDCVVRDTGNFGIFINGVVVDVRDSVIRNCGTGIVFNDLGEGSSIERCRIENNTAQGIAGDACCGGGGPPFPPPGAIRECVIAGNGAEGVYGAPGHFTFENCIIAGNALDGLHGDSYATNCTVWGNGGDGVDFDVYGGSVANSIVWGNGGAAIVTTSTWVTVTYSDVQGGYVGTGNIDAPPLLSDPLNGDFHLLLGSPCIDAGDPSVVSLPYFDLDGDARIVGAAVDIGADEFSGISLSMTQPLGPGSLEIRTRYGMPGEVFYLALTFNPANVTSPGTGWWGGLHISLAELVAEYLWGPPFLGTIDASGQGGFLVGSSVAAFPNPVFGVARTFDPSWVFLSATSPVESLLIQ